ncbi:MAG: PilZ domain-containing protein [Pseudomonadota bacterium]
MESMDGTFKLQLPEKSYVLNERRPSRFFCYGVSVELMQNGVLARGELIDFSPQAFRIYTKPETFKIKSWFNPDIPASVRLSSGRAIIFSGSCRCVRRQENHQSENIVFAAENDHIVRFQPKKIRNPRRQIMPSPAAVFEHPLLKKRIHRDIYDLSTTGFSIRDDTEEAVLMPGMMIPHLAIVLTGITIANCSAQIIYQRKEENATHYGIAILDMDIHAYSRINHLLGVHIDPHISVSTEVDMDALWEFFFQTGFIYSKKYGSCQTHRENFKETYRKLYQEAPEIARHVTYEKNGRIYGHLSMIRAYERTWLVHHHAASPMESKLPGFVVLRHMMLFAHGMYQLSSARMDYCICYFRPENKFPNRVFGGFSRDFSNPQACSLDLFAYLTLPVPSSKTDLPDDWLLRESSPIDLWELEQFYRRNSRGLLLNILYSDPDLGDESLEKVSERCGFLRKWRIYSLIYQDHLKAVFIVDQSDLVINMSDLLNCIKIIVTDSTGLSAELLSLAVTKLGSVYNLDKVTILIYPAACVESVGICYEKQYQLWILNMHCMNHFMYYVQKKFRMKYD